MAAWDGTPNLALPSAASDLTFHPRRPEAPIRSAKDERSDDSRDAARRH